MHRGRPTSGPFRPLWLAAFLAALAVGPAAAGASTPPRAGGTAAGSLGPRAVQAVMIANAADIVRLCRWLL